MSYVLQVDFPYAGPWGKAMTDAMEDLARSIAEEPRLLWKIWTENEAASESGAASTCSRTWRAPKST
ncbi:MAG: YdhR family protein [Pirellulaceae bacterium]